MCRRNEFPLTPLMHPDSPLSITVDKHPLGHQIIFLLQAQSLHSPIREPPLSHQEASLATLCLFWFPRSLTVRSYLVPQLI